MEDNKNQNSNEDLILEDEEVVSPESDLDIDDESLPLEKIKDLRKKLSECIDEKRAHHEALQSTKADYLNSKRRLEEQLSRDKVRVVADIVESLIPLCDSFDMAFSNAPNDQASEQWRKGIEGIHAQLRSLIRGYGVNTIEETGVPFDPNIHEAVTNTVVEKGQEDHVIVILQKGYRLGDTVIRPAKVSVGTHGS